MSRKGTPEWGHVVHPDAAMHVNCHVGVGTMILGGVEMTVNVTIGAHCSINRGVALGHDTTLGEFCTVAPLASVSGCITAISGVEIGTGSAIRQGVTLQPGCLVGMGGVVLSDVAANSVVVGNPAKPLKMLEPW